ncbi:hypothetical protein [Pseudoalteromonas arabiensis]|uniref:hypothetical protein n=1 Tax=Pseudoalteromonas arabiensis TaxID=874454 RepID=UPI000785A0B7|nr:hypothetical protein [Pseudoalteromonas arabiensis]
MKIKLVIVFLVIVLTCIYFIGQTDEVTKLKENKKDENSVLVEHKDVAAKSKKLTNINNDGKLESTNMKTTTPLDSNSTEKREQPVITSSDIVIDKSPKNIEKVPFDEQEVNYEWADEMTFKLNDLFSSNEQLAKLDLINVECRETLCHLDLTAEQDSESIEQAILIAEQLRSDAAWQDYVFYYVGQSEESTMTVEIGVK